MDKAIYKGYGLVIMLYKTIVLEVLLILKGIKRWKCNR